MRTALTKNIVPFLAVALALALAASSVWADRSTDPAGARGTPGSAPQDVSCGRIDVCPTVPLLNGEAYAGPGLIWRTNFWADVLELVDVTNGCQVLRTCPAPGAASPSELTLFNGILYHYDFGTGLLYGIDPSTCAVVYVCDPPGDDFAEGLTNDGQSLWKGDSQNLYNFLPIPGGGCQVIRVCPNPPGDSADGLTWCGTHLIMLGYSGTLYELDPATCSVVGSCPLNAGASGNGITSDRNGVLYADDDTMLRLDRVDVGCDIPVRAKTKSWGSVKTIYR